MENNKRDNRKNTSSKEDIINVTVNDRVINICDDPHLVSNAFNNIILLI